MMTLNAEDVVAKVHGMARGEFVRFISGQGDHIEVFVNEEGHLVFTIDDIVRLWAEDVYLYDGVLMLDPLGAGDYTKETHIIVHEWEVIEDEMGV